LCENIRDAGGHGMMEEIYWILRDTKYYVVDEMLAHKNG
jgi:hypothetical protein